jgi:hypothetical protein
MTVLPVIDCDFNVSSSSYFLHGHFLGNHFLHALSHEVASNGGRVAKCGARNDEIPRLP